MILSIQKTFKPLNFRKFDNSLMLEKTIPKFTYKTTEKQAQSVFLNKIKRKDTINDVSVPSVERYFG